MPRRRARPAILILFAALLASALPASAQEGPSLSVDGPPVLLNGVAFDLALWTDDASDGTYRVTSASGREIATGSLPLRDSLKVRVDAVAGGDLPLTIELSSPAGDATAAYDPPAFPGWISLLPPLLAIALALIFREVVVSLFVGVWIGAWFVADLNPLAGLWRTVDTFMVPAVANGDHAAILVFSALLGAMVGVISRSGGTRGIVEAVRPLATTPRRAQLATFLGGLGIFFDDYANTLIIGNTFRPITDRLRVSREKLAYIVDSTAAPVVTIVFVSTWVGFEISQIQIGLQIAADQATDPALAQALGSASPFSLFLGSIPYLFYPILAILLVAIVILLQRDFGPMLDAERRARRGDGVYREGAQLMVNTETSELDAKEGVPLRWYNAAVPVLTVVFVVLIGLYADGRSAVGDDAELREIFGAANAFNAILWGSLAGCVVAIGLAVVQRILSLKEALEGWVAGARSMTMAFVILILAWSLGAITEALGTARYLTLVLEGSLAPELLPFITFATAAVISFCTGTSWATMTILLPLVVPLIVTLGGAAGFDGVGGAPLLVETIAAVLAGSIFGDHCSPISDTTVLSSMASACDHMDHVRTQLPYALAVAVVAMFLGHLATSYGLPLVATYLIGGAGLFALVRFGGKPAEAT